MNNTRTALMMYSIPDKPLCACFLAILLLATTCNFSVLGQDRSGYMLRTSMTSSDMYEKGEEAREEGDFEEALAIWRKAVETDGNPDFRISHAYIDLTLKHELRQYYRQASEIYFWGLAGDIEMREKPALMEELEYLEPLLERKTFKDIKKGIEASEGRSLESIRSFWESLDPTPLTAYNERLIEHWDRVIYAREHYTKRNSDELDDRAPVYLKYGKPYYTKTGQLNYMASLVSRLLKEGIQVPSFGTAEQFAITTTQQMNLENRIRQYHQYPEYEIWIYRDLRESKENTIFMFGVQDGVSTFRKINSVDDFIPNAAYRTYLQHNYSSGSGGISFSQNNEQSSRQDVQFSSSATRGTKSQISLTPALILQLMYYQQFAALDSYFGRSFDEMMNRFIDVSNLPNANFKGLAQEFGTMYGNELIVQQSQAPREQSRLYDQIMSLPVESYQYRFLDEEGKPYTKIYSQVGFDEAAYYDILREANTLRQGMAGRYKLVSGLIYDEQQAPVATNSGIKTTHLIAIEPVTQVFEVFYDGVNEEKSTVTLSHELHKKEVEDTASVSSNSPFPASLKGLHNETIRFKKPLKTEGLVLSDLILGYRSAGDSPLSTGRDSLDFIITHDKSIPEGRDLAFYYEAYNVQPAGSDNISEYSFEYSIHKKKKGLFGGREKSLLSIDIQNTMIGPTDKNVITIDTSEQEEGDYELHIIIRDLNTGDSYTTVEEFSIEES